MHGASPQPSAAGAGAGAGTSGEFPDVLSPPQLPGMGLSKSVSGTSDDMNDGNLLAAADERPRTGSKQRKSMFNKWPGFTQDLPRIYPDLSL